MHGRNHRQGGSDPLFPEGEDAIRYNIRNVGDWLSVETTTTGFGNGMRFIADEGQIRFFVDDAAFGAFRVDAPFIRFDTAGVSLRLLDSGETFFECNDSASWTFDGNFALQATTYNLDTDGNAVDTIGGNLEENVTGTFSNVTDGSWSVNANDVSLTAAVGAIAFGLNNTGTELDVFNHLGAPIFRIDEGGDVHISATADIIKDL